MDYFKLQLDSAIEVTKEILDNISSKKYSSERDICIGDKVLVALLETNKTGSIMDLKVISIHIDEMNTLYEFTEDNNEGNGLLPVIRLLKTE